MAETKTKGGLLIPETAQKSPLEATVVAAGPGARNANTGRFSARDSTYPCFSISSFEFSSELRILRRNHPHERGCWRPRPDARVGKQQAGAGRPGVPRDQGDRHRRQALGLVRTQ